MKAIESRTVQSTFFLAIVAMIVAIVLELVPELTTYDAELFDIIRLSLWVVAVRFGAAGIVTEAIKAYKG